MEPQEHNSELSSINFVQLVRNYLPSHTHCHIPECLNHEQNLVGISRCIVHDVYASAVLYIGVKRAKTRVHFLSSVEDFHLHYFCD